MMKFAAEAKPAEEQLQAEAADFALEWETIASAYEKTPPPLLLDFQGLLL